MRWSRALVTGASSGIGDAMARRLAEEGTDLVIVARDAERLEALAAELPVKVEVLPADLSDRGATDIVAGRIEAADDPVDLVVNNAGFGTTGPVIDQTVDSQQQMVAVNVAAVVRLGQAAAKTFVPRGDGAILNVSSVAGFAPAVNTATYNATKAFVTSFSQSLHEELRGTGVKVSALCPGLTRTEFQERAEFDASALPDVLWQSADAVARAGLDGVHHNRAVVVSGLQNKAAVGALKLMPSVVQRRMSSLITD